jgi:Mg/Co/Ni transporter MgtE
VKKSRLKVQYGACNFSALVREQGFRTKGYQQMFKRIATLAITIGMMGGLLAVSASAQTADDKSSDSKMSQQQKMDKMHAMSAEDKAAMFDHMSEKDKMSAAKMAGHDMSKMSHADAMDTMSKMSAEDKAAIFDKMPSDKKMAMMQSMDKMKHDSMQKK